MKILWLSHNLPYPPITGVLQRNYNLIREASRYAEIHLVAVFKEDVLPIDFDLDEAREALGKFCASIEVVRLPIEQSRWRLYATALKSLFTRDPMSVNWIKSANLRRVIRRRAAELEADIVHFDTISLGAYRDDVGDVATIMNHHNIESHLIKRRIDYESNPLKRLYYSIEADKLARYERDMCPRFDVNFTVSELDAERLRELAPGIRTAVIANGVDLDFFQPDCEPMIPGNLVMASGMNWFPNRDAALYMAEEIWPLLAKMDQPISWTVVGSDPPQQLLDLAARDPRVEVTGFVDDVRPYLERAEVYLCPMRDGGGTRLKILDALSMKKAIVATTMALEGIHVTPEQEVLVADDPQAFAMQIGRLLESETLRQSIENNAREFVNAHFSWPIIGKRLNQQYLQILNDGKIETHVQVAC